MFVRLSWAGLHAPIAPRSRGNRATLATEAAPMGALWTRLFDQEHVAGWMAISGAARTAADPLYEQKTS
jgi:hypothetical protein